MNATSITIICLFLTTFGISTIKAQSNIEVNGIKINTLDKQKRKQGSWVFFDGSGNSKLSCVFKDDNCISPIIFYEKGDTAFIKFPITDSIEPFILYKNKQKFFGNFVQTSDSTEKIEVEQNPAINDSIISEIMKYKNFVISPVYFFAQKKMKDYLSAGFSASNMIFNKPIIVLLTISSAGIITKVEFPRDKNNLSVDEESELHWIYSRMPRWQPYFFKNRVRPTKILLSNNSTLSITSY